LQVHEEEDKETKKCGIGPLCGLHVSVT
jgi:hypothetical protein